MKSHDLIALLMETMSNESTEMLAQAVYRAAETRCCAGDDDELLAAMLTEWLECGVETPVTNAVVERVEDYLNPVTIDEGPTCLH